MTTTNGRAVRCEEDGCSVPSEFVRDDGRCWSHSLDPEVVKARDAARRLGGAVTAAKAKRGIDPGDLPPLDGPHAAAKWAEVIGRAVATGALSSSQSQAAMRAVSEFLRAHEQGKMKDELDQLRAELRTRRRGTRA